MDRSFPEADVTIIEKLRSFIAEDPLVSLYLACMAALFAGFFFADTGLHRNILYASFSVALPLLIRDRREVWRSLAEDRVFWSLLAAFAGYMTLSVAWSETEESGRYFEKGKVLPFLAVSMLASYHSIRKRPAAMPYILGAGIVSAGGAAVYIFVTREFDFENLRFQRLNGLGRADNPVQGAFLYGLMVITALFGNFERAGRKLLLALVVILPFIYLTGSRGPVVALVATLAVMAVLRIKSRWRWLVLSTGVIAAAAAAFTLPMILKTLPEKDKPSFLSRADTGRLQIWEQARENIESSPVFGHGLASKMYYTYFRHDREYTIGHAHSLYFSTLLQGGVIGLGLFLAVLGYAMRQGVRLYDTHQTGWPLAFLVAGAILGIFDFGGYMVNLGSEWLAFWWPAVLASALLKSHIGRDDPAT